MNALAIARSCIRLDAWGRVRIESEKVRARLATLGIVLTEAEVSAATRDMRTARKLAKGLARIAEDRGLQLELFEEG